VKLQRVLPVREGAALVSRPMSDLIHPAPRDYSILCRAARGLPSSSPPAPLRGGGVLTPVPRARFDVPFGFQRSLTPRESSPFAILRTIFRTDELPWSRGLDPFNSPSPPAPINLRRRYRNDAIRQLKMADSSRRSSLFSAKLIRSTGRNSSSIVELAPASALPRPPSPLPTRSPPRSVASRLCDNL